MDSHAPIGFCVTLEWSRAGLLWIAPSTQPSPPFVAGPSKTVVLGAVPVGENVPAQLLMVSCQHEACGLRLTYSELAVGHILHAACRVTGVDRNQAACLRHTVQGQIRMNGNGWPGSTLLAVLWQSTATLQSGRGREVCTCGSLHIHILRPHGHFCMGHR